uniref:Membrane proteins related to metalloendopeptidases n=1 Tax=uncultured SAR11 cluster bacterium HF0770_37D02 TaxID=710726 RepID=E0XYX6_9PROT|nr:membrane proteins related to metalloendopeptidases [uncultured SAR11 cluster bacterium HF0770_37D02]
MYQILKQGKEKAKYFVLFTFVISLLLLVAVVFKNDEKLKNSEVIVSFQHQDLTSIKKFLLKKIKSPFININYEIKSGDSIQKILKKFKIENNEIQNIINQYKKYGNPNQLFKKNKIDIVLEENVSKKGNSIIKFSVPITKSTTIEITKNEQGKIISKKIITKLYKKRFLTENVIKKNLYSSAIEAKINPNTIIEFARIFGFEIDFQRDIRKNDYFRILHEKFFDENGQFVKDGSILYAHMSVNNREITLYKFGDSKNYEYFDINGKSVEKTLMKTPINGARLSSPFGKRKHPILGFTKMHKGTDFAAPSGTPIMASGSGHIVHAKWCGGGGNCIKIKHNSTYETVYGHLKSFAKGIRKNKKVKQGQIIGYVGSTGMSTGPHLHYEVIVNRKRVNSQTLKLPSGKVLKDNERKLFEIHRIKTDVLIAEIFYKKN